MIINVWNSIFCISRAVLVYFHTCSPMFTEICCFLGNFAGSYFSLFRTCVSLVLCPAEIIVTFSWNTPTLFRFSPHFSDVWTINGKCWWLCFWLNPTVGFLPGVKRVLQEEPSTFHQFCEVFDVLAHTAQAKAWCTAVLLYLKWDKMCWVWETLAKEPFITVAVAEWLSLWWKICSWAGSNGHLKSIYWYNTQSHIFLNLKIWKGKSKSLA